LYREHIVRILSDTTQCYDCLTGQWAADTGYFNDASSIAQELGPACCLGRTSYISHTGSIFEENSDLLRK